MYYAEEITIKEMIVHILDPLMSDPILSKQPIEDVSAPREFFLPLVVRLLNDDQSKQCEFETYNNLFYSYIKDLKSETIDFTQFSLNIAEKLFAIMKNNIEIPAADLALIRFMDKGVPYIAMLKLNYQKSYIHDSDFDSEYLCNHVVEYRTSLPSPSQRITEGVVVNLDTLDIQIVERSYIVEGQKQMYLSSMLLQCKTKFSSKEQLNIVKQAANSIGKKFYKDNPEKKMEITKALYESIQEDGIIELETYADRAFPNTPEIKEQFIERIEKKGLESPKVQLQEKTIERAFSKQKIKTNDGIEITIPMHFYQDPEKMEIITNEFGKISIVIKDIEKIL